MPRAAIFDDSLSAVDATTEEQIHKVLLEEGGNDLTRIVISHRIASIKNSDQIFVFNEGKLDASGTHDDLLKNSPTYAMLNELQQTEKNLEQS